MLGLFVRRRYVAHFVVDRRHLNCAMGHTCVSMCVSESVCVCDDRLQHLLNIDNDVALLTTTTMKTGNGDSIFKIDAVSAFRWKIEFSFTFSEFPCEFWGVYLCACVNLNLMSPPRYLNKLPLAFCLTFCYFGCWLVTTPVTPPLCPTSLSAPLSSPFNSHTLFKHVSHSTLHSHTLFYVAPAAGVLPPTLCLKMWHIILDKWPHSQRINLYSPNAESSSSVGKFENALIKPFRWWHAMCLIAAPKG